MMPCWIIIIVEQTNIYAQQYINATTLPPHFRVHGWNKEVHDRDELKRFLAMIITMGLVNYPHVEDYWATYWPYTTPTFSKVNQQKMHKLDHFCIN